MYKDNCLKTFTSIAFIIILLSPFSAKSQTASREDIMVVLLYKITESIDWPNTKTKTSFKITLLGKSDKNLNRAMSSLAKSKKIKGLKIDFRITDNPDKVGPSELILVNSSHNKFVEEIAGKVGQSQTLLITSSYANKRLVMINFIVKNERLNFEYNKANIINQGLTPGADLILFKGAEIDVAKLYREGQASLLLFQKQLRLKETELSSLKKEVNQSQKLLGQHNKTISEQTLIVKEIHLKITKAHSQMRETEQKNSRMQIKINELNSTRSKQQTQISAQTLRLAQLEKGLVIQNAAKKSLQLEINNKQLQADQKEAKITTLGETILSQQQQLKSSKGAILGFCVKRLQKYR